VCNAEGGSFICGLGGPLELSAIPGCEAGSPITAVLSAGN